MALGTAAGALEITGGASTVSAGCGEAAAGDAAVAVVILREFVSTPIVDDTSADKVSLLSRAAAGSATDEAKAADVLEKL